MKKILLTLFTACVLFLLFPQNVAADCRETGCPPPGYPSLNYCEPGTWVCTTSSSSGGDIVGEIKLPAGIESATEGALGKFIQRIIQFLIIVAGLYALINLILAGYAFMSAGDDPKKIQGAWAKIWQTLLGLAFTAGAFVIAAIIGKLIFGDALSILKPEIPSLISP